LILRDFLSFPAQSDAITAAKQWAMPVVATAVVVDAIAVANVEAVLGAIPPDRALHEPRKRRWGIELASIDVRRQEPENAGASSRLVASVSIRVAGAKALQDIAWPARSPVNASQTPSRKPAHGSGSMWFATPSS
jgi:hypothetical protein